MRFSEMDISKSILDILEKQGMREVMEIQKLALPLITKGFDIIGQFETGSGKTVGVCDPNNRILGKNCLLYTSPSPRD